MESRPAHFYNEGEVLYHYTSADAAITILESQKFWLSEFSMTNDSSEYVYSREAYVREYQNRQVWIDTLPRYVTTTMLVGSEINTTMFIGSLTKVRDDLSQWDRYADRAGGCVVGIDAQFLVNDSGIKVRRISYGSEELSRFVNSGLLMLQSQFEEHPDDIDELKGLASQFVADLFAFKNPAFASEQEIRASRMLVVDDQAQHRLRDVGGHRADGSGVQPLSVKLRNGKFGPTRFIELPLARPDGRSAIRSIGLGPICPDATRRRIEDMAARSAMPVEVWRSAIPLRG